MSNGDPIKAGEKTTATGTTCLFAQTQNFNFSGDPVLYVGVPVNEGDGGTTQDVDCLTTWGINSGTGVTGWGGLGQGTGLIGWGGVNFIESDGDNPHIYQLGGTGVVGAGGPGSAGYSFKDQALASGTVNPVEGGWGVFGFGGAGDGAGDIPTNATNGQASTPGVGVYGGGGDANGAPMPGSGVVGQSPAEDPGAYGSPTPIWTGNGVVGTGPTGVYGFSAKGIGVLGITATGGQGVVGRVPVSNSSADAGTIAVHGAVVGGPPKNLMQMGPFAGRFDGPVVVNGANNTSALLVNGDFTVLNGSKNVAVPFPDGSHRRLYCVESPECWFEDFGEARLVRGKANVKLPRDFANAIRTTSYHVFLAPYGSSNGLYVTKRTHLGFVVEEQGKGKSSLRFSYRIVGKRKDVNAKRFAKVIVPKLPKPPRLRKLTKQQIGRAPKRPELRVRALPGLTASASKPSPRRGRP